MRLGFTRFLKLIFASLFIQTSWSFFSLQRMGFLFGLITGAKKGKKDEIMKAHKEFFNTHPYMASYIIGATTRAYDEGKVPSEAIKRFVTIAQTSFASAGDLLFWRTIRPALLLLAVILAVKLGVIGPISFIVVYNILHLHHRIKGIKDGYDMGFEVIYLLKSKRFTAVQHVFEILGAFFSGFLLTLISLKIDYLLLIPLALLLILLLVKRVSSISIIIAIALLMIIITMVRI